MSAEQDAGKSGKKLAALLGLGSIILFGGGYIGKRQRSTVLTLIYW